MNKLFTALFKRLARFRKLKKHVERAAMITAIVYLIKERKERKAVKE